MACDHRKQPNASTWRYPPLRIAQTPLRRERNISKPERHQAVSCTPPTSHTFAGCGSPMYESQSWTQGPSPPDSSDLFRGLARVSRHQYEASCSRLAAQVGRDSRLATITEAAVNGRNAISATPRFFQPHHLLLIDSIDCSRRRSKRFLQFAMYALKVETMCVTLFDIIVVLNADQCLAHSLDGHKAPRPSGIGAARMAASLTREANASRLHESRLIPPKQD